MNFTLVLLLTKFNELRYLNFRALFLPKSNKIEKSYKINSFEFFYIVEILYYFKNFSQLDNMVSNKYRKKY